MNISAQLRHLDEPIATLIFVEFEGLVDALDEMNKVGFECVALCGGVLQ